MGGALLSGWINNNRSDLTATDLIIIDPNPGDSAKAAIESGALHLEAPNMSLSSVETVLLAIKPQGFAHAAPALAAHLPKNALIVSILAGTSMKSLIGAFPNQDVIRAMPNTPASEGAGITAFTCGHGVTAKQKALAQNLLSAGGPVYEVENEHLIDVVTAVSGSGPAYVFHMVEALEAAALKIGMPGDLAPNFARQTIIGAGSLLENSDMSASELRQAVTSPNGTTQAALDVLMPELPNLLGETVKAALARAKELAKG